MRKYSLVYFAVVAAGLGFELFTNWVNTLAVLHFEANYGVEGSWLGSIFGDVINYSTSQTWYIHTTSQGLLSILGELKPACFVSGGLMLGSSLWIATGRDFSPRRRS